MCYYEEKYSPVINNYRVLSRQFSHSGHLMVWLLQCTLHGITSEDHLVGATDNSGGMVMGLPWDIFVKLLLHELHWLPVFFQGQFKMLNLSAIKLYVAHGQLFEGPPSSWSFCKSCQGGSTLNPLNQTISSRKSASLSQCLTSEMKWFPPSWYLWSS